MHSHELTDKASLSGIRRQIHADLNRAGVDPSCSFDCLVAVTEACTNAIVHGGNLRTPQVSWRIDGSAARFTIEDYTREQWSRWAHPSRCNGESRSVKLQKDQVGGMGLQLMRGLMDEVDIQVRPSGTTVEMIKKLEDA